MTTDKTVASTRTWTIWRIVVVGYALVASALSGLAVYVGTRGEWGWFAVWVVLALGVWGAGVVCFIDYRRWRYGR